MQEFKTVDHTHSFNVNIAKIVGVEKAILLKEHCGWCRENLIKDRNTYGGIPFTFNSAVQYAKKFPYMNEKSIGRWLKELERDGWIASSKRMNRARYDRTKHYTINFEKYNCAASGIEYTKSQNEKWKSQIEECISQIEQSISQNEETIPSLTHLLPSLTQLEGDSKRDDDTENHLPEIKQIVSFLNDKAGRSFKHTTNNTQKKIRGRIADGYTVDDFKAVICFKVGEWLDDDNMNQYLCPDTLFRPSNFEKYLQAAKAKKKKEQPTYTPPKPNRPRDERRKVTPEELAAIERRQQKLRKQFLA